MSKKAFGFDNHATWVLSLLYTRNETYSAHWLQRARECESVDALARELEYILRNETAQYGLPFGICRDYTINYDQLAAELWAEVAGEGESS